MAYDGGHIHYDDSGRPYSALHLLTVPGSILSDRIVSDGLCLRGDNIGPYNNNKLCIYTNIYIMSNLLQRYKRRIHMRNSNNNSIYS